MMSGLLQHAMRECGLVPRQSVLFFGAFTAGKTHRTRDFVLEGNIEGFHANNKQG